MGCPGPRINNSVPRGGRHSLHTLNQPYPEEGIVLFIMFSETLGPQINVLQGSRRKKLIIWTGRRKVYAPLKVPEDDFSSAHGACLARWAGREVGGCPAELRSSCWPASLGSSAQTD